MSREQRLFEFILNFGYFQDLTRLWWGYLAFLNESLGSFSVFLGFGKFNLLLSLFIFFVEVSDLGFKSFDDIFFDSEVVETFNLFRHFSDDARRQIDSQLLLYWNAFCLQDDQTLRNLLSISLVASVVLPLDVQIQRALRGVHLVTAEVRALKLKFKLCSGLPLHNLAAIFIPIDDPL